MNFRMWERCMERRVLVTFKKDVPEEVIANFYEGLQQLAAKAEGLVCFKLYEFKPLEDESGLNKQVANVHFPDIMTLWKFENEQYLNKFITSPYHLDIAREKFKPAVDMRVVFNNE